MHKTMKKTHVGSVIGKYKVIASIIASCFKVGV